MTPSRFDIYARADGRWKRIDNVDGEQRDHALAKGATLDGSGAYDGIRVMAVTEYQNGKPPLETLAWISPHLSRVASVSRQMRQAATSAEEALVEQGIELPESLETSPEPSVSSDAESKRRPRDVVKSARSARHQTGPMTLAGKLIWNGILSMIIATVAFIVFSPIIQNFGARSGMSASAQEQFAVLLTLLVFVVSAAFLMGRVYRAYEAALSIEGEGEESGPTSDQPIRQAAIESAIDMPPVEATVQDDKATEPALPETVEEAVQKKGGGLDEQMRREMFKFLEKALLAIKDQVPKMNRHVTFGLNLFISGAAEKYGEHVHLSKMQSFVLIREMVEALGNSPDRVDIYCRQYDEYAAQEAYQVMITAGRTVMDRHIEKQENPFDDFSEVMREWTSDSAARARAQGIVCIMFTDLVGSTQMTHERGDYGAQEIVRIHNAIVRSSLAAHHGREVKHTGDGIMASFTVAGNAVRASIEIQTELARHNENAASQPVHVRIGLNAGEAVEEEDDFFGTTVQIAARVCDKADTGEIFVTEPVQELSRGQGLTFEDAGPYEMKGVPEPMTLFRVLSNRAAAPDVKAAS